MKDIVLLDQGGETTSDILLVEDDDAIAKIILFYLNQTNEYRVKWVPTAGEALAAARGPVDLILLDICLPDLNGTRLCSKLRESIYCPIIFISCIDDEETIIRALETGGDDYLTKPFSCKVLQSRIEANLRRVRIDRRAVQPHKSDYGDFRVDDEQHTVTRKDGETSRLGPIEFSIFTYFLSHPQRSISLGELYEAIWGKPSFGDVRTVMVHVSNLRKIIEPDRANPRFIRSIRGHGYYFCPDGQEPDPQISL